jgi:hypothetical protein
MIFPCTGSFSFDRSFSVKATFNGNPLSTVRGRIAIRRMSVDCANAIADRHKQNTAETKDFGTDMKLPWLLPFPGEITKWLHYSGFHQEMLGTLS